MMVRAELVLGAPAFADVFVGFGVLILDLKALGIRHGGTGRAEL